MLARRIVGVLFALVLASGCYMRVKISSGEDAPEGYLRAAVVAHSLPGEGYDEKKTKDVHVSIYRRESEPTAYVFKTEFSIVAADLDWRIHWASPNNVVVEFFERHSPDKVLKVVTVARRAEGDPFAEVGSTAAGR